MRASESATRGATAGTRSACTPRRYDGLPGDAVPGQAHVVPDDARDGRLPRVVRGALRAAGPVGVAVDALTKEGDRYVVTAGDRRFEADNVVVATGVMQKPYVPASRRSSIRGSRSSTRATTATSPSCRRAAVLVVGASHSGPTSRTRRRRSTPPSCRADTGQIPPGSTRGAGAWASASCSSSGRTSSPWTRRSVARCARTSGTAALRSCGIGRRTSCRRRRADPREPSACRTGCRCSTTARRRRPERRLVHRVPARLLVDRRPVRGRGRRLPRAVPRRRRLRPGLYFVGLLFLHSFTSMLIGDGPGRRAGREAHRGAAGEPARVRHGGRRSASRSPREQHAADLGEHERAPLLELGACVERNGYADTPDRRRETEAGTSPDTGPLLESRRGAATPRRPACDRRGAGGGVRVP